jgi:hypothetical protein
MLQEFGRIIRRRAVAVQFRRYIDVMCSNYDPVNSIGELQRLLGITRTTEYHPKKGGLMTTFVIDDAELVPTGYELVRQVKHAQAADELRGKNWHWYIDDQDSENFRRLEAFARDSGVTLNGDNLANRKLPHREVLRARTDNIYLVITSQGETYTWYAKKV